MLVETKTPASTAADRTTLAADALRAVTTAEEHSWRAKIAEWQRLKAIATAYYDAGEEDAGEEADSLADAKLTEILNSRAPTLAAMADKGRLLINEVLSSHDYAEASADNPAYLSHLMDDGWVEHALISLFQDAAALASPVPLAIADARPQAFSGSDWLVSTALKTGARYSWVHSPTPTPDHLSFDGPGAAAAQAAFDALPEWHQDAVKAHLRRQSASFSRLQSEQIDWSAPSSTTHMIRLFAELAASNAEPEDVEKRAVIRRRLRETMRRDVGLPVGAAEFSPEQFTAEAYALGARFKMVNPLFGPELLKKHGDESEETKALSDTFCTLDGDQIDQLTAFLLNRMEWAKGWVSDVERDTGCFVSYHVSGVGFGIGPDETGQLAAASAAFSALSDRERSDLKAFGQARAAGDDTPLNKALSK